MVYKDKLYRAIDFLLWFEGSEDSLPTCDSKPQGLLRLISDSVPFEYIMNLGRKHQEIQGCIRVLQENQSAEFDSLTKAAKKFSTAFSGAAFAASERNHQHHLSDTDASSQALTSATKPVATGAVVPYQKLPRRTVAVMESVEEENDENIDPVNNFDSEDDLGETDSSARDKKLNAIIASDKLGMACFGCVTKNSCSIPNCEYSHDRDIIAAARDKQMADLTQAKRQMQTGHQATLKIIDKQGAKAVKPNPPQMRPTHTDTLGS